MSGLAMPFSQRLLTMMFLLPRHARELRARDPLKRCLLQYDRLYVGGQAFLFNEIEGRVEPVRMRALGKEQGAK